MAAKRYWNLSNAKEDSVKPSEISPDAIIALISEALKRRLSKISSTSSSKASRAAITPSGIDAVKTVAVCGVKPGTGLKEPILVNGITRPVSSSNSRLAAWEGSSPGSTAPIGNSHECDSVGKRNCFSNNIQWSSVEATIVMALFRSTTP